MPISHLSSNSLLHYFSIFDPLCKYIFFYIFGLFVLGHTTLNLCYSALGEVQGNGASKLKKGLFSVERVPKGIFWGETYFLDFYSIAHTIKLCPSSDHVFNCSIWNFDNLEHADELKIGAGLGPALPVGFQSSQYAKKGDFNSGKQTVMKNWSTFLYSLFLWPEIALFDILTTLKTHRECWAEPDTNF